MSKTINEKVRIEKTVGSLKEALELLKEIPENHESTEVDQEIIRVIDKINEIDGHIEAEIVSNETYSHDRVQKHYRKERYTSYAHGGANSYDERVTAFVRTKTERIKFILIIDAYVSSYNYIDVPHTYEEVATVKLSYQIL